MVPIREADPIRISFSWLENLQEIQHGVPRGCCEANPKVILGRLTPRPKREPRSPHRHLPPNFRGGNPLISRPRGRSFQRHGSARPARKSVFDGYGLPPPREGTPPSGAQNFNAQYYGQAPHPFRQDADHTTVSSTGYGPTKPIWAEPNRRPGSNAAPDLIAESTPATFTPTVHPTTRADQP